MAFEHSAFYPSEVELGENLWQVAPGIVRISHEFPNIYVVQGEDKSALIDTGWGDKEEIDDITTQLASNGSPLEAIVVTHNHSDHNGGIPKLRELHPDVPVLGLTGAKAKSVRTIELGGRRLTVIQAPGHTADSKYVYDSKTRALFTGDNILGDLTADIEFMGEYMDGLGALVSLEPQILCPGHYEPNYSATQAVQEVLRHREEREQQVLETLAPNRVRTLDQLFDGIYGKEYERKKRMATFQIESHLIKLEGEGKVDKKSEGWVLRKSPSSPCESRRASLKKGF